MTSPHLPPPPAALERLSELPLRDSETIQGDILADFCTDHRVFIFLQFADAVSGRGWLHQIVPRIATTKAVATSNAQYRDSSRQSGGETDPGRCWALWVNVSLTSRGLVKLAPGRELDLEAFPAFYDGPALRAALLGDEGPSAPSQWVVGGSSQHVDALLTVGADEPEDLGMEVAALRALAATYGVMIVFEQRGDALPSYRRGHEHFGFKDGISQPGVRGFHPTNPEKPDEHAGYPGTKMVAAGEFVLGYPRRDGTIRPHPAWMADGSFQVFRRLLQDVPSWWAQVRTMCQSLPPDASMTEELLSAKMVGRWRSGLPLAHAPECDDGAFPHGTCENNFDFADDPEGYKTPHFAHIRKMHPRGETFNDERRRIIRRAIPFGPPFDPLARQEHGADAERGLLFTAFMASIEDQFEFLQRLWANTDDLPQPHAGVDAIIGVAQPLTPARLRRPGVADQFLAFQRFVYTTGAVYAFAPSLTTLKRLAAGKL